MTVAIQCQAIGKTYGAADLAEVVLREVDVSIHAGEACILLGPSGSGKTTLLSILGCLLTPTTGTLTLAGKRVDFNDRNACTRLRCHTLGFVFQHAQLLPFLSVQQNVALVAENSGLSAKEAANRTAELFERLAISHLAHKKPNQLSGGQRQRVAIGRALVHKPAIVLADEPTAALDWHYGQTVADLLIAQTRDLGAALVVVSHDQRLVPRFDRILGIDGGYLSEVPQSPA